MYITMCSGFLLLLLSAWLAMHASVACQSFTVRMLTQFLRLPIPTQSQLDAACPSGTDFEGYSARDGFRAPVLAKVGASKFKQNMASKFKQMIPRPSKILPKFPLPRPPKLKLPTLPLPKMNWPKFGFGSKKSITAAAPLQEKAGTAENNAGTARLLSPTGLQTEDSTTLMNNANKVSNSADNGRSGALLGAAIEPHLETVPEEDADSPADDRVDVFVRYSIDPDPYQKLIRKMMESYIRRTK
jgi:hypothetical protein